jgi:hypothetical protein
MITVGQIRKLVLHTIREYSNSGEVITSTDNKDYLLSIIPLINLYQRELAITTHKIKKKYEISHNQPTNQLGLINWNESRVHTGGADDNYSAQGSRAYSFQVAGYATVDIQEEIAGIWTTLTTITHTPTDGEGYVTYKGLIAASDTNNMIRLNFAGDYRYSYQWVALFSDNFFSAAQVPLFQPYVPYDLPELYYMPDKVEWSHADRQLGEYSGYKMDYNNTSKKILINWYEKGNFIVRYFAYPTILEDPNPDNIEASDALTLDIADECLTPLVLRISSNLMRDENAYLADTYEIMHQIAKAELVQNDNYEVGEQGVILNSNW